MISVSIIIPIYNVEQYIDQCITSVLNQTYKEYEVILVDDYSPDESFKKAQELIENYAKEKDVNFKFVKHHKNRGLSAARNSGLKVATGDYVYFLDSDDEITEDCIETLVKNCNSGEIDAVIGGFRVVGNPNSLWNSYVFKDLYIYGNKEIVNYYVSGQLYVMAWNKLVRRDILLKNKLFFLEGVIHEDNLWTFLLVNNIHSLKTLSHTCYLYFHREGSITGNPQLRKRYDSYVRILEAFDVAENRGDIKSYKECTKFIDSHKLRWVRQLCKSDVFCFKEKWSYFIRVFRLNRGPSFLFHYSILPLQEFYWSIIDAIVVLRSKILMSQSK